MTTQHARRGLVAGLLLAAAVSVSAQPAAPPKDEDVLQALLTEVRGLRAAMEQMASAGPRIQLFTSRLQLQESRINSMVRRLDTVRDELAKARHELQSAQDEQSRVENALATGSLPNGMPREDAERMLRQTKLDVADRKPGVARLTAEETQLTGDIASEQARWTEINSRLDDLERALARK
jgi:chromosome segregation ATPase